ncbi:MAG: glycoside hydrolase family 108 protein [Bacteroidales bacterium]
MQSERFQKFMKVILRHEGGFVNDPDDPGGATKYGISIRLLASLGELGDIDKDGDVDIHDILALGPEEVAEIYFAHFYEPLRIEEIKDSSLAMQVFDFAVNAGSKTAVKILQESLKITADGIMGPRTLAEVNNYSTSTPLMLYRYARNDFYRNLASRKPKLKKFLQGWLNRVADCAI